MNLINWACFFHDFKILKAVPVFMGRCFCFKTLDGPQMVEISYLNIADWPQNCQLWCGNINVSPFYGVCSKSIEFLEFLKLFEHTPKKPWVFCFFFGVCSKSFKNSRNSILFEHTPKIGDFPQILGYAQKVLNSSSF